MLSAADADRIIGELILDSELRVLGALENSGHDPEALELWAAFLDDAETLTRAELSGRV